MTTGFSPPPVAGETSEESLPSPATGHTVYEPPPKKHFAGADIDGALTQAKAVPAAGAVQIKADRQSSRKTRRRTDTSPTNKSGSVGHEDGISELNDIPEESNVGGESSIRSSQRERC